SKLLADYGADVIKIERPGSGDPARAHGPFPGDVPHPEKSGRFLHLNTSKRSVTLNLRHPEGRALALRLAAGVDIVIENFRPGTMERLGLGEDALRAERPLITFTRISNFGQTGPYRDYPATELTLFALGSRMSLMGEDGREPVKYADNAVACLAGAKAAAATMAALWGNLLHGIGQTVDLSIQETLLSGADNRLVAAEYSGEAAHRADSAGAGYVECLDGHVQFSMAPPAQRHFTRLVRLLNMPELLTDPRFATPADRNRNRADLEAIVRPWLMSRKKVEIAEQAQAVGFFAAAVLNVGEVLENPHFAERGFFNVVEHPVAGAWKLPGAPVGMALTPWQIARPAPLLGQHTDEVLTTDLGLTSADLARLRAEGIV
ncbi:MAG: CoA transferase, partial [Chloroflexi bacterium]|nr:CoA transferase [Chloroflexota bacterium]